MTEIFQFYMTNKEFREFVDKYRFMHRTTLEGSLKCMSVLKEYKKLNKNKKIYFDDFIAKFV